MQKISNEKLNLINKRNGRACNFIMALASVNMGEKMTRISWNDFDSYVLIVNGILVHNKPFLDGQEKIFDKYYPFILSPEDIWIDDWIII